MGQRNSLFWDLPALDAFAVNQAIYRIPPAQYREALDELVALLGLQPLLGKQVRTLSLGERMRCEIAGALLHRPRVLFMDESTLGLDVNGQAAIREFLAAYNTRHGATILLTSHYMGDVTALAERVLVIDAGRLRFDGNLQALLGTHAPHRVLRVTLADGALPGALGGYGELTAVDGAQATLRVPRADTRPDQHGGVRGHHVQIQRRDRAWRMWCTDDAGGGVSVSRGERVVDDEGPE